MSNHSGFGRDYAQEQLRRSRHPLRRIIKHLYINNILQDVEGPSIDFGCGARQLLTRLTTGSVGPEVNPFLVEVLCQPDLNLRQYNPDQDRFLNMAAIGNHFTFHELKVVYESAG